MPSWSGKESLSTFQYDGFGEWCRARFGVSPLTISFGSVDRPRTNDKDRRLAVVLERAHGYHWFLARGAYFEIAKLHDEPDYLTSENHLQDRQRKSSSRSTAKITWKPTIQAAGSTTNEVASPAAPTVRLVVIVCHFAAGGKCGKITV